MELWFYPAGGIVASGGGTPSVDAIDLLVDSDISLDIDKKAHLSVIREHVQAGLLDPVQVLTPNQTWNASTTDDITLEALGGKSAGLLLCVGTYAAAAASFGSMNYM